MFFKSTLHESAVVCGFVLKHKLSKHDSFIKIQFNNNTQYLPIYQQTNLFLACIVIQI